VIKLGADRVFTLQLAVSCKVLAEAPRARFRARPSVYIETTGEPEGGTDPIKDISAKYAHEVWRVDFGSQDQTYKVPGFGGSKSMQPEPEGFEWVF
jgi:hypothetical protein